MGRLNTGGGAEVFFLVIVIMLFPVLKLFYSSILRLLSLFFYHGETE